MPIEKDIKQQKPFNSVYQKVVVNVVFTSNWMNTEQQIILKPFDLSAQQYNVLRILRGQGLTPISINGIIDRMLDKMSNASRLVEKLVQKNMVSRCDRPNDRRSCDIRITDLGLEVLKKIDSLQASWEQTMKNLSETEAQTLSDLLDKMRGSIEA